MFLLPQRNYTHPRAKLPMTRLVPARESERLAELHRLAILDTEPEPQFDAICRDALCFFRVPIAYIAFLDENRQWLKAACGIASSSIPRERTFCASTILLDRLLIVRNAMAHPRYSKNDFVLGPPHIRFYAGAPLALNAGLRVGTFCLIDTVPRELTDEQVQAIKNIAGIVVEHLRMRA